MATLHLDILKSVSIASPCTARWEDMTGDERTRHCGLCNLNVHNLSAMSREEAESLVVQKHADPSRRLCIRFYQRFDGTIITQDCPRGLAAARARLRRTATRVAAAIGISSLATLAAAKQQSASGRPALRDTGAIRWVMNKLVPAPIVPPMMGKMCVMGAVAVRPTPPPPPPAPTPKPKPKKHKSR